MNLFYSYQVKVSYTDYGKDTMFNDTSWNYKKIQNTVTRKTMATM